MVCITATSHQDAVRVRLADLVLFHQMTFHCFRQSRSPVKVFSIFPIIPPFSSLFQSLSLLGLAMRPAAGHSDEAERARSPFAVAAKHLQSAIAITRTTHKSSSYLVYPLTRTLSALSSSSSHGRVGLPNNPIPLSLSAQVLHHHQHASASVHHHANPPRTSGNRGSGREPPSVESNAAHHEGK
jgi:hypothetical protein